MARRAPPRRTTLEVRVTFEPSRLSPACVAQVYEQVVPLTHRPVSRASHRGLVGRESAVQPVGVVNVLSGAPYGYRYVPKHAGGGQARYDIVPEEARVVRQGFAWVGRDRLTIGAVCWRLTQAGEATRTGKTIWDRSAVWGMLKNPAYMGAAAFGKTRQGPLQPRLRSQRGRPWHPKRAVSSADVPPEDWIQIPVPALVESEVFAAVQEQLRENQRYARQPSRGALYLL